MGAEGDGEAAELLEVTDADGRGTGEILPRGALHRQGAWHRTRSVWVLLREPAGPALLLQKRGAHKQAAPGRLDASAAGHVRPGELDPWREVQEELGRRPKPGEALPIGTRRQVYDLGPGGIDREVQELWLWRCPYALQQFRPAAPEVAALVAAPVAQLGRLLTGELDGLTVPVCWAGPAGAPRRTGRLRIDAAQFLPGDAPYVAHIAELARRCAAGAQGLAYDTRLDPPQLSAPLERSSES